LSFTCSVFAFVAIQCSPKRAFHVREPASPRAMICS
jgi:hypothetical protein